MFYDRQSFHPFKAQWELYVPPALKISLCAFCIYGFSYVLAVNRDYILNSINKLIFVMVKCSAFFEVRTEFLNII
jgi:hypothetical protein